MSVYFFDDDGGVVDRVDLFEPASGRPFLFRLSEPIYHFVVPTSPWVVYHEVLSGPFDKDMAVIRAPFAPDEDDREAIAAFFSRVIGKPSEPAP